MIPDNHNLLNAYFINNEKDKVKTVWKENGSEVLRTYMFEAKDENPWWPKLLKQITLDEIHANTVATIRRQREAFESQIIDIARSEGLDVESIISDENKTIDFILDWFDKDFDNEQLFKIKLPLFEKDKVMNSQDRTLKANLRKATSVIEIMEAYSKF